MLLTKLHIPAPCKNLVFRETLLKKLNEGLNRKLILISAPAGFGKTTLISEWIHQYNIATAWFSIDKNDNDPVEFLIYLISATQGIYKKFGRASLELLRSPQPPEVESIVDLLVNEIVDIKKDFILVLDDFHLINNTEIFNLLVYLLDHVPSTIHVAILTRSDPSLAIARLRSQHQLLEFRSSDLCFSTNDIHVLFNKKLKIKLSAEDASSLETKTEGWIAGLQLTALSMFGHDNISAFVKALKGDNRYIMDYLIEEVLKNQSDEIKEFLLQTSILEQISAPLCNQVLNRVDSQLILEKLEKSGMFVIPLDTGRHWYRYHHLFADLLKQRLLLKDKTLVEDLHKKAGEWFEDNEMYDLAIEHTLVNKDYVKTIKLLGEVVEHMWENGRHSAILKYGDILPDELLYKSPNFCLFYSWILIVSGEIKKAEPYLSAAEIKVKKQISEKNSSEKSIHYNKKLFGKIAVAFAYLNSHLEHSEKIFDYCSIAMENLSEEDPMWYSWAWFSFGIAHFSNGELLKSKKAFNKAFDYGKKSGSIYLISTIAIRMAENEQQLGHFKSSYKKCSDLLSLIEDKGYSQITKAEWIYAPLYLIMGVTDLNWAHMDKANENIRTAYNLSKKGNDIFLKIYVLIVYSTILKFQGDASSAQIINELENLIRHNTIPPFLDALYVAWKIHILMDANEIDQAIDLISDYGLGLDKEKNHGNEGAYSAYARVLLEQRKLDEAESLLSELYSLASSNNGMDRMVELKISFTQLYKFKGENDKAVKCLMEALEMSADEEQLFIFVFWSDSLKSEFKEVFNIQATTSTSIPREFMDKLKLAIKNKDKRKNNLAKSELSERELDTLKGIAENLTNQEIADQLFISLNTVKTHLKNINLKLDVDSRAKAVTKAKHLQWI